MHEAEQAVRALVVAILWSFTALQFLFFRRQLPRMSRLALDFSLLMYLVTFYFGLSWLFIFQGEAINQYFNGAMDIPDIDYWSALWLSSLPLIIIPGTVYILNVKILGRYQTSKVSKNGISDTSVWVGVAVTTCLVMLFSGGTMLTLARNAIEDLAGTTGIVAMYARRKELFESMTSVQTGLLYGTLPACATLLLFYSGRKPLTAKFIGLLLGVVAVVLNAGLFQIGPILVFGLTCSFCYVGLNLDKIRFGRIALIVLTGFIVLNAYHALKTADDDNGQNILFSLALRMPIALPYLYQMDQSAPELIENTDSLSHELGEFMFPNLATAGFRFVAMPLPAFIHSWFVAGGLVCILTLIGAGLGIAVCGRLLEKGDESRSKPKFVMASVFTSPLLYYLFQISFKDVFFSSYSIFYVAIPIAAISLLSRLRIEKTLG
jgi:hypothetical protein